MTEFRDLKELRNTITMHGRVEWIGLSPGRREPIHEAEQVFARVCTGLEGDHHADSGTSQRQVTLVQAEHLPIVASWLDHDEIRPAQLRRNLLVSGVNLLALKNCRFQVGEAILEGSGPCAPCSRMEETIGPGGYNALRGHGGITAVVIEEGWIRLGDQVTPLAKDA